MEIKKNQRLAFIDVLRGLACVWMIQTHVLNTCLSSEFQSGTFWNWLNISNGFVSVCFVFCAGAGFSIFTSRNIDSILSLKPTLFTYLKRLGFILFIGYVLQLPPEMSWNRLLSMNEIEWMKFYEFDVLHTIVASSVVSLIIVFFLRVKTTYKLSIFFILSICCYILPLYLWDSGILKLIPYEIGTIFEKPPLSAFPLFPWMGHYFLGISITGVFYNSKNKRKTMLMVSGIAFTTFLISLLVKNTFYTSPIDAKEWWDSAFSHFVYRGSLVAFLFSLIYFLERFLHTFAIAKFFQILGKESLVIYALHLFLLYSTYKKMGLKEWFFNSSTPTEVVFLSLSLTIVSFFACYLWSNSKKKHPTGTKIVQYGFWFWFFVFFFFGKQLGLVVQP